MAMTTVNARIYVARIIGGGANSQESLDMADESILRTYQDWQAKKFWRFLLKDTAASTAVSATVTQGSAVIAAPSAGAFDFVNRGQTVTYSGAAGALAASTTVSSYTRNSDGTIATITLSATFTGSFATETGTLTFSADIPIQTGVNEYNLPLDYASAFTLLFSVNKRTLTWKDQRWMDRIIYDQTASGFPVFYTTYNPVSELTQKYGERRMKFEIAPSESDLARLRYYRGFITTGTYVDIPDQYLYKFLDYARNILLATKRAQDDPAAYAQSVAESTEGAAEDDEQPTDDDDADQCMKSQWEMGNFNRQLWHNGQFDPYN